MAKIWVVLLAALAFVIGAAGGLLYGGVTGGMRQIRIACELLDTAERSGMLDNVQRADIVDRVVRILQKSGSNEGAGLFEQMKTECPNLPGT